MMISLVTNQEAPASHSKGGETNTFGKHVIAPVFFVGPTNVQILELENFILLLRLLQHAE